MTMKTTALQNSWLLTLANIIIISLLSKNIDFFSWRCRREGAVRGFKFRLAPYHVVMNDFPACVIFSFKYIVIILRSDQLKHLAIDFESLHQFNCLSSGSQSMRRFSESGLIGIRRPLVKIFITLKMFGKKIFSSVRGYHHRI